VAGGVVVGVHHADTSSAAVHWAADESRMRGLPLTLVHAWKEPVDISVDLDELPDFDGPAESRAEQGRAAAVLLAHEADLLVLGGHSPHTSHAARLVLHRARCPVVVVPDSTPARAGRVVVGVTRSDASRAAIRWATQAAALRGATLVVVHAWQRHEEAAQELVRELTRDLVGRAVETRLLRGAPLDRLLTLGESADLLVLGRRVHHGVDRILHASISDEAAALAECPVAVIPVE
jgi:nucleotide-binding universal stress UspA family protein